MILHNIKMWDILWLEAKFAYLTQDGWMIPRWVILLVETCKEPSP
jgi:hypothetical protein